METLLHPSSLRYTRRDDPELSVTGAPYAGVDVSAGGGFAGLQARLNPKDAPTVAAVSVEGSPLGASDRWQANADALYPIHGVRTPVTPYVGGGLCVVGRSSEGTTQLGLNLIGGASLRLGPLNAFLQLRVTFADGVHVSLTGGVVPPSPW